MKYFLWSFSLQLVQEGQLSISGERKNAQVLVNSLEDKFKSAQEKCVGKLTCSTLIEVTGQLSH